MKPPAPKPCDSCPYRRDVPSGIWHEEEYQKLPEYDKPTGEQPMGVFMCHQQDGRMCAGWVAVHDMDHTLAIRVATATNRLSKDVLEAIAEYKTDVSLFSSGKEAAEYGMKEIKHVSKPAQEKIHKITRRKLRNL